jgi:hypothetical protein
MIALIALIARPAFAQQTLRRDSLWWRTVRRA